MIVLDGSGLPDSADTSLPNIILLDTRLFNGDMSGIKIRECQWSVKTAGPSPFNNERTELFLLGTVKYW